ncbi:beta strand repeat-containing protein [Xanthomonas hortorum]|uniref:beta strand repeat-containing protein n=1 Tax=Xanthomonas hortorum TaxID=56454 RepID=UPI0020CE6EE9|nr:YadA-like family protein [Xanthomonas hortorum]
MALGSNDTATNGGASAAGANSIAIGGQSSVTATSTSGIAVGRGSAVSGTYGIAQGDAAIAGSYGIATGRNANAGGAGAVALGANATAGANAAGTDAVAVGAQSSVVAAGTSGIALGRGATVNGAFGIAQGDGVVSGATGRNVAIGSTGTTANGGTATGGAVAIGRAQTATGNGAVAIGDPNTASGTGAVAVGADNTATGQGALALGNANTASGQGAVALGNASSAGAAGAVAMGDGASANIARSVALGSGSSAAAAVGTTSTVIRGTTYNFAGTAPTSTVSVGTVGNERTVTNVAAGRLSGTSTDAVNGSQLFATDQAVQAAGAGFALTAQGANGSNVDPSEAVDLNNTDGNILVSKTGGNNNVSFDLADDITVNSVTAGATTLNSSGLVITGGPSVTVAGINAGSQVITNVAAGVAATDGVNKSQLDAVGATANAGFNVSAQGANSTNVAPGEAVDLNNSDGNIVVSKTGTDDNVSFDLADDITVNSVTAGATTLNSSGLTITGGPSVTAAGINAGGQVISNVAAGALSGTSTDAVNGSQLFATNQAVQAAGAGFTLTAQGANGSNVDPSEAVDLNNSDGNILVSKTGTDNNVSFDLADDITINSVTAGATTLNSTGLTITGGPSMTAAGINAGNQVITNVAAGVAATDGVNKSQLDAVGATANAGFNVSAQGANSTNVAPGEAVDLNNTDGNIVVSKTGTDNNVSLDLADDITVNSVTTGATTLNSTGLVITGGPSVTAAGINAGGQVITNVAAGVAATDGVNKSQLDAVAGGSSSLGLNFTGNDASAGDVHRDLGQTLSIRGDATAVGTYSGGNIKTVTDPATGAINVQLADSPKFGNVIINDGGTGKISGVAAADLSAASTEAVNGSQLFQTNQDVAALDNRVTTAEGDITTLDNRVTTSEGDITNIKNQMGPADPAYLQQNGRGTRYARTNDTGLAEDDAHAQGVGSTAVGYNATSSAADAVAIGRNAQAGHAGSVAIGAGSVANGSTLGNAAYLVGGTATGEVNVGNRRVTGVTAGAEETDAVNVGQLKAVAASATQAEQRSVKYDWNDLDADGEIDPGEVDFSKATLAGQVSTDGGATGGSKLTNLAQGEVSATSTDAVNGAQLYQVAGPSDAAYVAQNGAGLRYARSNDNGLADADAHAQGVGSTAVGYNATGSAENAVAVGRDAVAGHANSVALGAGSSTTVGAQNGYNAAYVGSSNSTGQVHVGGRTIGGMAAGSAADDAVNVAQLQSGVDQAVTQANNYTDTRVDRIAGNVAQYDDRIATVEGDVNNVRNGSAGLFQVSQDNNAAPTATGTNASAGGAGATASGTSATALGSGAIASAGNAVALGAGSVANQEGTVSVGSAGSERRVTNVAVGTADTDAVNVAQLKGFTTGGLQYDKNADGSNNANSMTLNPNGTGQTTVRNVAAGTAATDAVNIGQLKSGLGDAVVQANSYTDGQVATVRSDVWNLRGDVRRLERDMHAGIATAIAIKPAPYVAGRTTYYAGFGAYKSEAAFGVSLRHTVESGRWSVEGGASTNRDGIGAYVGVSGVLGD